jgi:hypothetical protein
MGSWRPDLVVDKEMPWSGCWMRPRLLTRPATKETWHMTIRENLRVPSVPNASCALNHQMKEMWKPRARWYGKGQPVFLGQISRTTAMEPRKAISKARNLISMGESTCWNGICSRAVEFGSMVHIRARLHA